MGPADMVTIATDIFSGKFPVAWRYPFLHAADHLDAALAAVEERIEIPGQFAEIVFERRHVVREGREIEPLVMIDLRHRNKAPVLARQLAIVGFLEERH